MSTYSTRERELPRETVASDPDLVNLLNDLDLDKPLVDNHGGQAKADEPMTPDELADLDKLILLAEQQNAELKLSVTIMQAWRQNLEAEKKAKREKGKAEFKTNQAAKPKKHPDDYRYGMAGRTRKEIEQYRRDNPELWNEYRRAKYAAEMAIERGEEGIREYRRSPEAQAENARKKNAEYQARHRAKNASQETKDASADREYRRNKKLAGWTPEQIEAGLKELHAKREKKRNPALAP
ncbi:hypothetical protein [Thalassorhabdomicrobium marinisediminis]|uniref:Uncharacterized protein n=1 Tax=Thalassorhabdomicrobium marinisediminis TaxID=2170577 RepID=A0A2T7FVB6_9RHOB|nr:hypothetical protein [Thalassorhabdomicrobium marinisediminis]PVA06106.1 hypothetical protein DC363_12400 [Thalassorhabdomicrobium marinisediminis]